MSRANHDIQVLMSRVVDGEATAEQWEQFQGLAEQNPTLWRELAEHQRDQGELTLAIASEISVADRVHAPVHEHMTESFTQRLRTVVTWGGWAAAAAVALMWGGAQRHSPGLADSRTASLVAAPSSPGDLLQQYLARGQESGQVVRELPEKVMIEARPVASGGYEVFYIRQIMERTSVPRFYTPAQDEHLRPVLVPVELFGRSLPAGPM
jgi:anti-sigma factor RsiW